MFRQRLLLSSKSTFKKSFNNFISFNKKNSLSHPFLSFSSTSVGKTKKRKLALLIGYSGDPYVGLHYNNKKKNGNEDDDVVASEKGESSSELSVADVLRQALYKSGMILESNMTDWQRVGWSSSSRTDKGVHSVGTIVAMKLECKSDWFDKNGALKRNILNTINSNLPETVSVFSCRRASSSYNARKLAADRMYTYYLPINAFGVDFRENENIDRLNDIANVFIGRKDFINFTGYKGFRKQLRAIRAKEQPLGSKLLSLAGLSEFDSRDWNTVPSMVANNDEQAFKKSLLWLLRAKRCTMHARLTDENIEDFVNERIENWKQYEKFDEGRADANLIEYYKSLDATPLLMRRIQEIANFSPLSTTTRHVTSLYGRVERVGDQDVLALHIRGTSFVYHQIRFIVGAIGAVFSEKMSLDSVLACFRCPAISATLPLAPPGALVLRGVRGAALIDRDRRASLVDVFENSEQLTSDFLQNVILPPVMKRDFHADWQESVKFYTETSEMEGGDRVSHNYSADRVVRDEHAHLYLSQLWKLLVSDPTVRFQLQQKEKRARNSTDSQSQF